MSYKTDFGKIIDIFSTPIYHHIVSENVQKKIDRELQKKVWFINSSFGGKPVGWKNDVDSSYGRHNLIKDFQLDFLSEIIHIHIDKYVSEVCYDVDKLFMSDSWINRTNNNQSQEIHSHNGIDNELISGVYYNKSSGNEGAIRFHTRGVNFYSFTPSHPKYDSEYTINPVTGSIILFPAHLQHSVDMNKTNVNRESIAFNFSRVVFPE